MSTLVLKRIVLVTWIASTGLIALHEARAEPPLQRAATAGKLDLRPPLEIPAGKDNAQPALKAVFLPAQGTHIMSPLQNLAHNFRQEGLPIAKLFQSDESLVHLGLNPKGKPGLWLVHKLH